MTALWIIIGLIISTVCVSTLGAAFSVVGLAALFSGATKAVMAMGASLELSKFVLAAYLHQRWNNLAKVFKYYLVTAIVILSCITSMGIFGFLSDAYQSASTLLATEAVKQASLKSQQENARTEIARLNRSVDEIPANRISRRIEARKQIEPEIARLTKQIENLEIQISQSDLKTLELQSHIGPLVYISKAFKVEIDTVVKYLILLFVSVFDPLAICLVIAVNGALESRRKDKTSEVASETNSVTEPLPQEGGDEVIHMRFVDDKEKESVG